MKWFSHFFLLHNYLHFLLSYFISDSSSVHWLMKPAKYVKIWVTGSVIKLLWEILTDDWHMDHKLFAHKHHNISIHCTHSTASQNSKQHYFIGMMCKIPLQELNKFIWCSTFSKYFPNLYEIVYFYLSVVCGILFWD